MDAVSAITLAAYVVDPLQKILLVGRKALIKFS
jgi:hypothetical protein